MSGHGGGVGEGRGCAAWGVPEGVCGRVSAGRDVGEWVCAGGGGVS